MTANLFRKNIAFALVLTTVMTVDTAVAEPSAREGERRGPPPEAIESCEGKSEGDVCGFNGRRGQEVEGTCFAPPSEDKILACRPDGAPGGQQSR